MNDVTHAVATLKRLADADLSALSGEQPGFRDQATYTNALSTIGRAAGEKRGLSDDFRLHFAKEALAYQQNAAVRLTPQEIVAAAERIAEKVKTSGIEDARLAERRTANQVAVHDDRFERGLMPKDLFWRALHELQTLAGRDAIALPENGKADEAAAFVAGLPEALGRQEGSAAALQELLKDPDQRILLTEYLIEGGALETRRIEAQRKAAAREPEFRALFDFSSLPAAKKWGPMVRAEEAGKAAGAPSFG